MDGEREGKGREGRRVQGEIHYEALWYGRYGCYGRYGRYETLRDATFDTMVLPSPGPQNAVTGGKWRIAECGVRSAEREVSKIDKADRAGKGQVACQLWDI
jgi:hypothetical protein